MNRNRPDEKTQRVLLLVRLDAQRLFERIKFRQADYMRVFSLKRSRNHFNEIFKNKYDQIPMADLTSCSQEVLVGLDSFYTLVDEMRWYLNHTEEMPGTVTDNIEQSVRDMEKVYDMLQLYITAEMGMTGDDPVVSDETFGEETGFDA